MIIIPQQASKKYSQPNSGDFFGNINRSKNITFFRNGYVRLEKRTRNLLDSQTYTDLTTSSTENIAKIEFSNNRIWLMGTKTLYYLDADLNVTEDVASGTPVLSNTGSDMCQFEALAILVVAQDQSSTIKYWDGASWGTIATDVSQPSVLVQFYNQASMAVAGNNLVQLIDSSKTKGTLLTLPTNFTVKSMDWNNNRLYIGCADNYGKEGFLFEWDGLSTEANYGYPVRANAVMSVKRYMNGVAFMNSNGQLMKLEGTISELANLPIYYGNKQWEIDENIAFYSNRVIHGGMVVDKDKILIAVDSNYSLTTADDTDDIFENDFASGIWEYDPDVGLHHRYSVGGSMRTVTGAITTANVNTATDTITIPSAIVPDTGTPVFYDDGADGVGTDIAPLKFNTRYFVIKFSSTTLKLAATYADAIAANPIDLTTTGNNSQTLAFCPNDDFGGIDQSARALYKLRQNLLQIPENSKAAQFLIGSLITKTSIGTTYTGLHAPEHHQENRGYFVTPRLISKTVLDTFQKMYLKFRPLVYPEDKIIVKYRKAEIDLYQNKIYQITPVATWVTNTTFTTSNITDMAVGYEVEIVAGAGSGYLAHITAISAINAGVYTITIDETVQNIVAGQTFNFTVENWTKLTTILTNASVNNSAGYAEITIPQGGRSTAMEFKVELRGEDVMIEEIQIINANQQPSA